MRSTNDFCHHYSRTCIAHHFQTFIIVDLHFVADTYRHFSPFLSQVRNTV
ncbi:hypothetical protein Lser_V15G00596 [Lactuca serriola]